MKPDNVRHDPEREYGASRAAIEAAGQNTQAPRRVRETNVTLGERIVLIGGSRVIRSAPEMIATFIGVKLLILSWLPHPSPALLGIAVCICLSMSVRGHAPDDMRYHGLRRLLQGTSGLLLLLRWGGGFLNGWENNCWWAIRWLPDGVRAMGDVDQVCRWLLVDPAALFLTACWVRDTWVAAAVAGVFRGSATIWNRNRVPREYTETYEFHMIDWLVILPILFATLPVTAGDWVYALALGLGGSFIVAYIVMVEMTDILCVKNQNVRIRTQRFWKYSERRYAVFDALSVLPRLFGVCVVGALAIYAAGKDRWLSLLPLAVVLVGCGVLYPKHFGLSWLAFETFEAYPGDEPPKAGVHDMTEVVRPRQAREHLVQFAVFAWVPFVYGCVYHFLPGWPQFDNWGARWPDLYLKDFAFGVVVLCVLPAHLACGVLRGCFGPLLGKYAKAEGRS